jgi:hypothetical protein
MKKHNLLLDFTLSILTLGLYNIWIQIRQILDVNETLQEDKYSLFFTLFLSLITLGLYFCYFEYKMTRDLLKKRYGDDDWIKPLWTMLASFLGLWFLVDLYQQQILNELVDIKSNRHLQQAPV